MKDQQKTIKFSTVIPQSIYPKLVEKFNIDWETGVIIANGDTIHCKYPIPPEKVIHEVEHLKQQEEMGIDLWWEMYLTSDTFRLTEEVKAYRKEYQFICQNIPDRNVRFEFLYEMARNLSSNQYGNVVSFTDAQKLINPR